ncbi:MAG TPA: replicative DNA helicase [Firmicutes bacterium]|nr:replicative DNA helicase [Bacillota bacterium]
MPFSNEAEMAVLGAMIISKEIIPEAIGIVGRDDFYVDRHKEVFDAIVFLYNSGEPIDYISLSNRLKLNGVYDKIDAGRFLMRLIDEVPSTDPASVKHYATIVRDKSELRQLIAVTEGITATCYRGDNDIDDIIGMAEQGIINITQSRTAKGLTPLGVYIEQSIDRIEELSKTDGDLTGITTGFIDIDKRTSGLHSSELILIAARPGMGKTSFALNIAQNAAIKGDACVAIFSLEMPGIQIANRMLSSQANVDSASIKTGDIKDEDWGKLGEAMALLAESKIYIDDSSNITASEIGAKCRKLKMERGLDMVIIDYLQLMSASGRSAGNRQQEISEISRTLKVLANDLEIPIIALSQLSRAVEKRETKEPVLSDLRESGAIEQDADMVMFLYREGYYDPETEEPNKVKVKFDKHRNGETGYEYLTWLGNYTKFVDWSGIRDD